MALNDVPLEDAGRDYYAQQFGNRIQNIRKYGATPPSPRNSGCLGTGGAAGGGIRRDDRRHPHHRAVAVGVGSSSYDNSYNYLRPADDHHPDPPPQVDWKNNLQVDPP